MFETDDMERYWNGVTGEGLSHMNDLFVYMVEPPACAKIAVDGNHHGSVDLK